MKLTNVARASLSDELVKDFESFLVQNGLRIWPKESKPARAMRARLAHDRVTNLPETPDAKIRLTGLSGLSEFVERAAPEIAANAMLCAVNQAAYLLRRQLESQSRAFLEKGGFTENLYVARIKARASASPGDQPCCPSCGKPMLQRCAKNGPRAGEYFWGCSAYPNCKGTRRIEKAILKAHTSPTSLTRPTSPTAHPKLP